MKTALIYKPLYHGTKPENIFSIMENGLKPGNEGYVYFCESALDCMQYSMMYNPEPHEVAIIPVNFTEEEIAGMEINVDNNPDYTPTAYAYKGGIDASRIPHSLEKILKYTLSRKGADE